MTRPETCDAAGGAAISLWLRLIDCPDWAGVISSHDSGSGFVLHLGIIITGNKWGTISRILKFHVDL